jgi:hypothetical protein
MANGTIAFDTLTTSDSKNTNTEKSIDTSFILNGVNKVWFTLGMDAVQDDSFNCSSVDDDGTGDFGIHFTNAFSNALYSSAQAVTVTGLNDRMLIQSPSKTASAVEVRTLATSNGSDTEGNITHAELQICGDLA